MIVRIWLGFIAIFVCVHTASACNCDGILPPISYQETQKYDVISVAKVDSVKSFSATENIAYLSGNSLYKGIAPSQFQIYFANNTSCLIPFLEQEHWLIYAYKDSLNPSKLIVNYCDRTRKWVKSNANDAYILSSGITYMEEIAFLEKNYPKSDFMTESQLNEINTNNRIVITADRRLEQATDSQKIIIIITSILAFAVIYILVRRMK